MKLKIITLHSIYNPGSAWQAYSLQEFLAKNGHDVEIIDYRPYYSTIGKNKLKGVIRKVLFFKNEKKLKEKYESFINSYIFLTSKRYKSFSALSEANLEADVFISGSDQLWNMDYDCGNDESYYLAFTKNKRKIAYATSIGKKKIPEEELKTIVNKITGFEMISVREKSTSEILSAKMNRNVHWVCDPVFLLDVDTYKNMTKPLISESYAVVYLSAESSLLDSIVQNIKETLGCKIVLMGGNRSRCECDIHIKDLGPIDFISLIENAEIVISSSFHATAFSHIFHKKFGVILPSNNGERLESLLELSGLSNRIIEKESDINRIYKEINYADIDIAIDEFVNKSKVLLLNLLK